MHRVTFALLIVSATLAISGCSGKTLNRMLTVPGSSDTYYNSGYYSANSYWPYGGSYNPAYRTDPLVRFPSDTRLAPYDVGNILSGHLAEFAGAFGGNFATLHQQLPFGLSDVSPLNYVMASPNTSVQLMPADKPVLPRYSLNLVSARDTVSFATYGLYAPNSNQHVLGLDVAGAASFAIGAEHGLYVGVRQFGEPRYNWYGPFKANETWHVDVLRDSNYQPGTAAYVTLAVFNGDTVRVDNLRVDMGG